MEKIFCVLVILGAISVLAMIIFANYLNDKENEEYDKKNYDIEEWNNSKTARNIFAVFY